LKINASRATVGPFTVIWNVSYQQFFVSTWRNLLSSS